MDQIEQNFKEVSFAVPTNKFDLLEKRVKKLEQSRSDAETKVENLKKVCKLQQEFFKNWEQEYTELKSKIEKGVEKNQQL